MILSPEIPFGPCTQKNNGKDDPGVPEVSVFALDEGTLLAGDAAGERGPLAYREVPAAGKFGHLAKGLFLHGRFELLSVRRRDVELDGVRVSRAAGARACSDIPSCSVP